MKAGSCLYFPGGTYIISASLSRLPKHSSVYCCEGGLVEARFDCQTRQFLLGQRP
jgi:hypothetical protein